MTAHAVVLVVDDDRRMRQLERRILEAGGYQVVEAEGAHQAFAILRDRTQVDLVIADLDMPEVSGEDMVMEIRRAKPGQRVLYVSGHVDRLLDERQVLDATEAFLDKPFSSKGLLEAASLLLYDRLRP